MRNEPLPAAQPEVIAVAEQVRALCSVITKIARADLESHLKKQNSGVSAIEHGVLRHLSHGITSMAEISRLMGVAPSTLVYVVDGMTQKKLVKRGKDQSDRRKEPLLLEKSGAELFARFSRADGSSLLVQSLRSMTASRRRQLLALLEELTNSLTGADRFYLNKDSATPATPTEVLESRPIVRRAKP